MMHIMNFPVYVFKYIFWNFRNMNILRTDRIEVMGSKSEKIGQHQRGIIVKNINDMINKSLR